MAQAILINLLIVVPLMCAMPSLALLRIYSRKGAASLSKPMRILLGFMVLAVIIQVCAMLFAGTTSPAFYLVLASCLVACVMHWVAGDLF